MKPSVISEPKNKKSITARTLRTSKKIKLPDAPIAKTLSELKRAYPDAHCALIHENPFQLLIATILSAQCTDERVNKVTPALFDRYPGPVELADAQLQDVERLIMSTNFYKNKSKNLIATAQLLVDRHGGEVPQELDLLVKLPGVGRKTANVVLGNAFGITSGVVVDTHVGRLSMRLGWTGQTDPVKIENDLIELIPKSDWVLVAHLLIFHGRKICKARNPECLNCFLFDLCPKRNVDLKVAGG